MSTQNPNLSVEKFYSACIINILVELIFRIFFNIILHFRHIPLKISELTPQKLLSTSKTKHKHHSPHLSHLKCLMLILMIWIENEYLVSKKLVAIIHSFNSFTLRLTSGRQWEYMRKNNIQFSAKTLSLHFTLLHLCITFNCF